MKDGKFEAGDIYALLLNRFGDSRQWLCAGEVGDKTGFQSRRLDFVAVNCYESQGLGIHAFEIKISKSDLRRELTDPSKHNIFFDDIDTYSIVAPDYVLDAEYCSIIPKNWGIYRATAAGPIGGENTLKVVRKPLNLHDERNRTLRRSFAFGLIRSLQSGMAERNALGSRLHEEYKRGWSEGEKHAKYCAHDYEKRYCEEIARNKNLREVAHKLGLRGDGGSNDGYRISGLIAARQLLENAKSIGWSSANLRRSLETIEIEIAECQKCLDDASKPPDAPAPEAAPPPSGC